MRNKMKGHLQKKISGEKIKYSVNRGGKNPEISKG